MHSNNWQIKGSVGRSPGKEVRALVVFFDLLNRPLKESDIEWHLRYGGHKNVDVKKIVDADLVIDFDGEYYFLKGRSGIVDLYNNNVVYENKFLARADKYAPLLRFVPFICGVALCNNLAFRSVDKNSDIDLFILTRKGRIFTARMLSTLLFHLLGVRRHGGKTAGRFCLSFYVAGSDFSLNSIAIKDDCYLYFWGRSLVPVSGALCIGDFWRSNADFLEFRVVPDHDLALNETSGFALFCEKLLSGRAGDYLEKTLKRWQLRRFEKRKKNAGLDFGVVVNDSMLKFHNADKRAEFARAFKEKMDSI